jgi:hypothetical protein
MAAAANGAHGAARDVDGILIAKVQGAFALDAE